MRRPFSRTRRFAISAFALIVAGVLFRSQIAGALAIRGDDYLYRGDKAQALERYRRALAVDPFSSTAADRYVFVSMQLHTPQSLRGGIAVASRYLAARPNDAALLADRALCYLHARQYALAQSDFERAARVSRAAGYYVFAGWAAQRQGRHAGALALWRTALAVQPHYRPAMMAIAEHEK